MSVPRNLFVILPGLLPGVCHAHRLGEPNRDIFHLLLEHGTAPLLLLGGLWLAYRLLQAWQRRKGA